MSTRIIFIRNGVLQFAISKDGSSLTTAYDSSRVRFLQMIFISLTFAYFQDGNLYPARIISIKFIIINPSIEIRFQGVWYCSRSRIEQTSQGRSCACRNYSKQNFFLNTFPLKMYNRYSNSLFIPINRSRRVVSGPGVFAESVLDH